MANGVILLAAALAHLCAGVMAAPALAQPQVPLAAGALGQQPLGDTPPSPPPITGQKKTAQSRKLHGRFLHITGELCPVGALLAPAPAPAPAPPAPAPAHPPHHAPGVTTGGLTLIGLQTSILMNSTRFTHLLHKAAPATAERAQQARMAPRPRTATHPSRWSMPPLTG